MTLGLKPPFSPRRANMMDSKSLSESEIVLQVEELVAAAANCAAAADAILAAAECSRAALAATNAATAATLSVGKFSGGPSEHNEC